MDKFTINFDNIPVGATARVVPLGTTLVSSAPPLGSLISYDHTEPLPLQLSDPYRTYFTIAIPPSAWLFLAKQPDPTLEKQEIILKKILLISSHQLSLNLFFSFEINSNLDFLHIHGVVCNKKNLLQLTRLKRNIRQNLLIQPTNKVATKYYQQSDYHSKEDQIKYHLCGQDYKNNNKLKINSQYYGIINWGVTK